MSKRIFAEIVDAVGAVSSEFLEAQKNHEGYSADIGPGKQVVGLANLAVLQTEGLDPGGPEAERAVIQEHWWWKSDDDVLLKVLAGGVVPVPEPLTKFRVSLALLPPPNIGPLK